MTFPFTNTAPAVNMPPSQSQPLMLENFASTQSILGVDHVTFNNATGGQHTKVTYVAPILPTPPTGTASIGFANTDSGQANTGIPELYWQNSQAIFPLSAIKAFGVFVTGASPMIKNGYNILSITGGPPTYTITLKTNVTNGNNVAVFLNPVTNWTFASNVLTIGPIANVGLTLNFLILQI